MPRTNKKKAISKRIRIHNSPFSSIKRSFSYNNVPSEYTEQKNLVSAYRKELRKVKQNKDSSFLNALLVFPFAVHRCLFT